MIAVEEHGTQDAFAALRQAKEAVLLKAGWSRSTPDADGEDWWFHPTMGRETLDCALAIEEHEHEQRERIASAVQR